MAMTPHRDKLEAALRNRKCSDDDRALLREARAHYDQWMAAMGSLTAVGDERVRQMTMLLNKYKDSLEVDLVAKRGSPFIKRQKGQLKLDNSVLEEFLVYLVHPSVIDGLPANLELTVGPTRAFMSLSFTPVDLRGLAGARAAPNRRGAPLRRPRNGRRGRRKHGQSRGADRAHQSRRGRAAAASLHKTRSGLAAGGGTRGRHPQGRSRRQVKRGEAYGSRAGAFVAPG